MMKYVIFDVDGTLVDSVDYHTESWQRAFEKFGKKIEPSLIREQIGKGGDQLMPEFLNESELEEFGEKLDEFRSELFKSEYLDRVQPFPQTRDLIEKLVADGKNVALASSASASELEHYKQLIGVEDILKAEATTEDAENSKPEPDIFEAALKKLGNPPANEVVVVGDSPYDAVAARKLDVKTVGLLSGNFTKESLEFEGCVEIYQHIAELLKNYEESIVGNKKTPNAND
ncbi:MAG: HAD family hydrolase [Pyrinomonadaceae bacterium]|nr:HAD family hydrolase [Pyrinomonadaceae bacterium]